MAEPAELPFFNFLPLADLEGDKITQINTFFKEIDDSLRWLFENSDPGGLPTDHLNLSNIGDSSHADIDSLLYFLGE